MRLTHLRLTASLLLLCGYSLTSRAADIHVNSIVGNDTWSGLCAAWDGGTCGPKRSIQAAIAVAGDGDTILLADGVYTGPLNRDITFGGMTLTLRSESGNSAACVIDCNGAARAIHLHSHESRDARIVDVTITGSSGPAVVITGSDPTFERVRFHRNAMTDPNGGAAALDVRNSTALFDHCEFTENVSIGTTGGAPIVVLADAEFDNCVFDKNRAFASGMVLASGGTFRHCRFTNNQSGYYAAMAGASLPGTVRLDACVVANNRASAGYTVIGSSRTSFEFVNCVIRDNEAGMAVLNFSGPATGISVMHCTIVNNHVGEAAIRAYDGATPTVENSIIRNDSPQEIAAYSSGSIFYCNIRGGYWGAGNVDIDPSFAFSSDPRLLQASPCIDVGDVDPLLELPLTDFDGKERFIGPAPDMGAFEHDEATAAIALDREQIRIDAPVGSAEQAASLTISNAGGGVIDWSAESNQDWLRASPASGSTASSAALFAIVTPDGMTPGVHRATLSIHAPAAVPPLREVEVIVRITRTLRVPTEYTTLQGALDAANDGDVIIASSGEYRGIGNVGLDFHGKAVTLRSEDGNPAACVIDCEGGGPAFDFHQSETPETRVVGFTIQNAAADRAVNFRNVSLPTLRNCRIINNSGGALFASHVSNARLERCLISNNFADSGVALYSTHLSDVAFVECDIRDNTASGEAGAIVNWAYSRTSFTNCTLVNNTAPAAAIGFAEGGRPAFTFDGCTVADNACDDGSPALALGWGATGRLQNTIFWNDGSAQVSIQGPLNTFPVNYSLVRDGQAAIAHVGTYTDWGVGNIDSPPEFMDADAGDYHLAPNSPCIDAGDPAFPSDDPSRDADNQRRVWNGRIDIGADEFNSFATADLNCDGFVNNFDIDAFVLALADPVTYAAEFPYCDHLTADASGDGVVNNFDIDAFISCLTAGGCE